MRSASLAQVALLMGLLCAPPTFGSDTLVSQLQKGETAVVLEYRFAECADNPECLAARFTCDDRGLGLEMVAVSSVDAGNMVRDDAGVTVKAGKQSVVLKPTELSVDELNGGWLITFGAWLSAGEEMGEVVDAALSSPLSLAGVAKDMSLALPSDKKSLETQVKFAKACKAAMS